MPVFPSFMRRMQQSAPAAPTLFQGGMTPRSYEIQPDPPPARSSADKIRETVSNQLRYEDIAPKLEQIPAPPGFTPKAKYGIKDRLKMALGGAGLGQRQAGGLGALGGIIAGLINPEGVDRFGYATYVKPQEDAAQQAAMARNKAKMDQFKAEMDARKIVSDINQAKRGQYKQLTGAAQVLMYNDATGEYFPVMIDGEPVEHPSIPVGRGHDTTQKFLEKFKAKETAKRDETRHGYKLAEIDALGAIRKAIADAANREAMKRLRIREGGQDRRLRTRLRAEGYDVDDGTGTGTGAGTGLARPGAGTATAPPPAPLMEGLRRFLGLEDEDFEDEDFWY